METAAVVFQPCPTCSGFGAFVFALFYLCVSGFFPLPLLTVYFFFKVEPKFYVFLTASVNSGHSHASFSFLGHFASTTHLMFLLPFSC